MSDTTFDSVMKQVRDVRDGEDATLAERDKMITQADAASEGMQVFDVDTGTLSAMADHLDAHQDARKAQQRVLETADGVLAALAKHRQLNEAHQDSPVPAADKEFYEEG